MSGFKFDKNDKEPDFSLGGDVVDSTAPAGKKPTFVQPKIGQPAPARQKPVSQPKPVATPQQAPVSQPALPTQPVLPQTPAQPVLPVSQPVMPQTPAQPQQPLIVPPVEQPQIQVPFDPTQPAYPQQPQQVYPQQQRQPLVSPPVYEEPSYEEEYVTEEPAGRLAIAQIMKKKDKKEKTKGNLLGNFKGNRKAVFYIRIGAGIVAVIVLFAGVKQIFFPNTFPSSDVVTQVVANNLGITKFPTDMATGFVTDFTKQYFTIVPENESIRQEQIEKYISKDLLNQTTISFSPDKKQTSDPNAPKREITLADEPLIVNIDSVDDKNAVFTMLVKLSTGTVLNVLIPVYYDAEKNAMAISAPLSIVPGLNKAKVPVDNHSLEWSNTDDEVEKDFQPDLEKYFEAWAASDLTAITRYVTTDSTLMTKEGLKNTVTYGSLTTLNVKGYDETNSEADPAIRTAYASVVWKDTADPALTYQQGYLLTIKQNPDGKWNIKDIQGTVVKEPVL